MKNLLFFLCLLVSTACSRQEKEPSFFRIDLTTVLEKDPETISLSDWAKQIRLIPLETNDSILISYVNKIALHQDKIMVWHWDRISIFDLSGQYLNDIGRIGGGPGEYARIEGVVARGDTLYVKETSDKIKLYDWQGTFLKDKRIPDVGIYDFFPLPGTDVMVGHIPNLSGKQSRRLLIFRDTTILNSLPCYKTYEKQKFIIRFYSELKPFDGTVTAFKEMFNDTIFKITPDYQVVPYATIELGKYKVPDDYRYTLTSEQIKEGLFNGMVSLLMVGEINDVIYMRTFYSKDGETFYYDKKEQQVRRVKLTYPQKSDTIPDDSFFIPQGISDDNLYLIGYNQPDNDDNPVIVLVQR